MNGKIIRVFQDISMSNSHNGLTRIAKEKGINPATMSENSFLVFINRKQTMVKVLTTSNHLAFYRSPHGRLTMQSIANIPMAFTSDHEFHMAKAIERALDKLLKPNRLEGSGERAKERPASRIHY